MWKLILNIYCARLYVILLPCCAENKTCSRGYVEIKTKYLLCQALFKYCYRVLLTATVVALVMWKLVHNIYCARLYINTATVCC